MNQPVRIEEIEVYALNIPFNMEFTHAMASRAFCDSLILKIKGRRNKGFGEAIIRGYVTGKIGDRTDLLRNARDIVMKILEPFIGRDISLEEAREYLESLRLDIQELPLLCAAETATLDIFCDSLGKDIYQLLGRRPIRESIQYGGVLPIVPPAAAGHLLDMYREINIPSLRIKVGTDLNYNKEIFRLSRDRLGQDFDLRVDANASWSLDTAMENLRLCREYGISLVEEPFGRGKKEIFLISNYPESQGFQFVADESAITIADIETMANNGGFHMVNLRLSKNGGLFKVLKMAEIAERNGLRYQLGCHVGETGILSALERVAASILPSAVYVDGSYDSYLLSENITSEDLSFGSNGMAEIRRGQGLGFRVDEDRLKSLSIGKA